MEKSMVEKTWEEVCFKSRVKKRKSDWWWQRWRWQCGSDLCRVYSEKVKDQDVDEAHGKSEGVYFKGGVLRVETLSADENLQTGARICSSPCPKNEILNVFIESRTESRPFHSVGSWNKKRRGLAEPTISANKYIHGYATRSSRRLYLENFPLKLRLVT